ncbi:hypothetical protein [Thermomonas sp.]|jgi:hypothetical protein|nr:hypothetical protein [Thermomonas sp.]HRB09730.1 hypothetical protein [Ottowia sp.]MBK6332788.1 hypothetical protein [Thermomonas sp.]MBK6415255.1 hypothetical protein [Thermomonas sp.]MBK6925955.1 hypothetical protein [Thermomonas sp.]MBK7205885.1 hypothetical protein [Thermomonas sp.]
MREHPATMQQADAAPRRKAARRTAMLLGAIAVAVYAGFILMGVLGQ